MHMLCVVLLKSSFFLIFCVFGSHFRTLAVSFASELKTTTDPVLRSRAEKKHGNKAQARKG